ncbi:YlmH family RNA-binding protein [Tepidibacter formicigenes]|jgi:RNA-binding protein YlmH|uniref:RNA-binding protein YlmH, contains S4-like domain n=1 Tax=Tepidibacter formicigenes DSM 15518 TaxID=1123349 RepID=A0A1M6KEH7_9FIRM|nr:YlmH/Sll1252 family protein [Tepidibacter formicigenes]SHJ57350.1 RNA-binding protein YlmH, contains S4-like domain [Tepidibacter formicigenes DSM 15518]
MIDKERLTNHIKDLELKNTMYKVIDKAIGVIKNHDYRCTDFLNPYEIKNAVSVLNYIDDVKYFIYGGYEEAERKVVYIYPYYVFEQDLDIPIKVLEITGNFKFKEISHRDYLGAILGLGIKREKIGDILIHKDFWQVIVKKDICDFLLLNLNKVGNNSVKIKEINFLDIKYSEPEYKEVSFTVSSQRLDCIISGIYNLSRQESTKLISSQKVCIDFEPISSASKVVKEESLISVKGRGRAIISEIGNYTKKGRVKVKAKIIL